jgi:hypothetical protein
MIDSKLIETLILLNHHERDHVVILCSALNARDRAKVQAALPPMPPPVVGRVGPWVEKGSGLAGSYFEEFKPAKLAKAIETRKFVEAHEEFHSIVDKLNKRRKPRSDKGKKRKPYGARR